MTRSMAPLIEAFIPILDILGAAIRPIGLIAAKISQVGIDAKETINSMIKKPIEDAMDGVQGQEKSKDKLF